MIKWLKQRARHSLYPRFNNLIRRGNHNSAMYVPDDSLYSQTLKLVIVNDEGKEYHINATPNTTIEELKKMAVGSLFSFREAVRPAGEQQDYRFVLLRDYRSLDNNSTVGAEKLKSCDTMILVPMRPNSDTTQPNSDPPSLSEIKDLTKNTIVSISRRREKIIRPINFEGSIARIFLVLIEYSTSMIVAQDNYEEVIDQIFAKLNKRHQPAINKSSVEKLTEMGFSVNDARLALNKKRSFDGALMYLLQRGGIAEGEPEAMDENCFSTTIIDKNDPVKSILDRFKAYKIRWKIPNREEGFHPCDNEIVAAILDCPAVHVALGKPKTLLALFSLNENPNNVNVWLSDPDTNGVISEILRIYHLEKHSDYISKKSPGPLVKTWHPPKKHTYPSTSSATNHTATYPTPHLHMSTEELLSYNASNSIYFSSSHAQHPSRLSHCNSFRDTGIFGPIPDYIYSNNRGQAHSSSTPANPPEFMDL